MAGRYACPRYAAHWPKCNENGTLLNQQVIIRLHGLWFHRWPQVMSAQSFLVLLQAAASGCSTMLISQHNSSSILLVRTKRKHLVCCAQTIVKYYSVPLSSTLMLACIIPYTHPWICLSYCTSRVPWSDYVPIFLTHSSVFFKIKIGCNLIRVHNMHKATNRVRMSYLDTVSE